jgi:beta-lactamase superfamily II metal-dependent hydrolase
VRGWLLRLIALWALASASLAQAIETPLTVYFFDVGQGDAALIVSPEGKTVLIDGGPPESGPALARMVKALTHGPLDLVVLTHAHLDHLGGMVDVLEAVGAKRFMEPGFSHPSHAYELLLRYVEAHVPQVMRAELDPQRPTHPVSVTLGPSTRLTLLWPRRPVDPFLEGTRSDPNANSLVLHLRHAQTAFLFAGDAEAETESQLLRHPKTLRAQVLKVAHHGSSHSTGVRFLMAVRPQLAVVSSGAGNPYGHPAAETLGRMARWRVRVLRTDQGGEVVIRSNGRRVWVNPRPVAAESPPP